MSDPRTESIEDTQFSTLPAQGASPIHPPIPLRSRWHIVTGEFPPTLGGVSDYSLILAVGLAEAGDDVTVWCPAAEGTPRMFCGVQVHRIAGQWGAADFDRIDAELDTAPSPRRLLVQWVPQAYGRRSINVAFCRWLRRRARAGDLLELIIHEPCLAFGEGGLRYTAAAVVQRLMLSLLLSDASRVWMAIPAWEDRLKPWAFGREIPYTWLPIPSTVPVAAGNDAGRIRAGLLRRPDGVIIGHLGTYSSKIQKDLSIVIPLLLAETPRLQVNLLGRGSERLADSLLARLGSDAVRVEASGALSTEALSEHLQACDVMLQPYPDGASCRRTTLMAALAHGLPVVTTLGRLSEPFWSESTAVATVPAGDHAGLVRAVVSLVNEPSLRHRLSSEGQALYESTFSVPRLIKTLRDSVAGANRVVA